MKARGMLFILIATLWFSAMSLIIKALGPGIPVAWTAFLRNALALPLLLAALGWRGESLRSPNWDRLCLRGLLGLSAMCCQFWALPRMPIANTMLLSNTAPIYAALWGTLFLGESLDRRALACMGLAFAGVYVTLKPSMAFAPAPAFAALAAGFLSSLALSAVKSLTKDEPALRIISYFALVASLALLPWVIASGYWPGPKEWGMMSAAALAATGGQVFLTWGLKEAPVSKASFAGLFMIVLNIAGGWAFFGEVPDRLTWLGCLMIGGGILGLILDLRRRLLFSLAD